MMRYTFSCAIACSLSVVSLGGPPESSQRPWYKSDPFAFSRVEVQTPGGPLPFIVGNHETSDWTQKGLTIRNGSEVLVGGVIQSTFGDGREQFHQTGKIIDPEIDIHFTEFQTRLVGQSMQSDIPFCCLHQILKSGSIVIDRAAGPVELSFITRYIESANDRFDPILDAGDPAPFAGRWSVDFSSTDDPAVGVFEVDAEQIATGTFLTPTGDYRYLAGRVDGDLMRLSTFDGAHAFLFHARMQEDGTIAGDFWSGNWHHETWTAVRDDARLPDAFTQTAVADPAALDDLVFKSLDGTPTKVTDLLDASGAKARIIEVFGSWCPNCADAGAEMRRLKDTFGDDLAIVGLAFERTEDFARSAKQVRTYTDRFNADWPVLIAGLSDKARASAKLPILDKVRAYPTTIFLNAENEIVAVHTGFNGPATGDEHTKQQAEFERIIRELIAD